MQIVRKGEVKNYPDVTAEVYAIAKAAVEASRAYWGGRTSLSAAESVLDPVNLVDDAIVAPYADMIDNSGGGTRGGTRGNVVRMLVEQYEFVNGKDPKVFAYFSNVGHGASYITGWMGNVLGRVESTGSRYRCGFGRSYRQAFRARCVNGGYYFGTYFVSSGDYVRMRLKGGK